MYQPIKKLGQNFLTDFYYADKMVNALDIESGDIIVEIGPGLGFLTEKLSKRTIGSGIKIYAIEIDERFVTKLEAMFAHDFDLHVVKGDILKWLPNFSPEKNFKILGSLPYYITSPIIHATVERDKRPLTVVYLIQKEVAEKICSEAPNASYMSIFVQTFFYVSYLGVVPKNKFIPSPQVDGGIIKMTRNDSVSMSLPDIFRYEKFLHKGFKTPRKMLNKVFSAEELEAVGIPSTMRPQEVSTTKWQNLFWRTKRT